MFVKELSCPYCGATQDPHGFGQLDYVNTRKCQKCGREFVFTVSVMYQAFVEADFSETQTEETPAVDTLKQMVADAPKEEVKANISSEIMAAVSERCRGYGKKQALIEKIAAKTGHSVSRVTNMLSRACMMNESVAKILSAEIDKPFYINTVKLKHGATKEWRIESRAETKAKPEETETQAPSQQPNLDGMTTFEYIFGYNTITETRKINPADIPAYLEKLSAKKEHRDVITGKPKPWELLKINGVPVEKEDAA